VLYLSQMNRKAMIRVGIVLAVVLVSLGAVGGVAAANEHQTAERSVEPTTAEPGETVTVTVTVELPAAETVDYVDNFETVFAGADNLSLSGADDSIAPILQNLGSDGALVALPEVGPGTVEISYDVTVPQDATSGSSYGFNGTVQFGDDDVPVTGDTELTVAGGETRSPALEVVIDGDRTDRSVSSGETLTLVAAVGNTRNETVTQSVRFDVNGTQQTSESVTLGPEENDFVMFSYETSESDAPAVDATVMTDNDSATATVSIMSGTPDDAGDSATSNSDDASNSTTGGGDGFGSGFGVAAALVALLALALRRGRRV
jgi:hypothetical protein